jgi:hypothetical protein
MRKLIIVVILIMSGYCAKSQQTTELGVQVAAAIYWGDVERVNYSKSITPVAGILGRYNFNNRMAVRGQLLTGNLKAVGFFSNANIGESGLRSPDGLYAKNANFNYDFTRSFQSVEALFEYNFFPYKLGSTKKETFTPFVEVGLGAFFSRALRIGSFILQPYVDATNGVLYSPERDANLDMTNALDITTVTIPVGIGIKFNITKRLGGVAEVVVRKTFSDNIDNLDDPMRFKIDPNNAEFIAGTYQYPPKNSKFQLNNNDWYATFAISLCYQLWTSKGNCAIYDKYK